MAYDNSDTFSTGNVHTAAHHTQIKDNFDAVAPNGVTWQTYVPALSAVTTDPTLGTGSSQEGHYFQVGKVVKGSLYIAFGSSGTNAGSGTYTVSLPVAVSGYTATGNVIGSGYLLESGVSRTGCWLRSNRTIFIEGSTANVSHNTPFAWGANDVIAITFEYQVA